MSTVCSENAKSSSHPVLVLVTGLCCAWDWVYKAFPSQDWGSNATLGDSSCWAAPLQAELSLVLRLVLTPPLGQAGGAGSSHLLIETSRFHFLLRLFVWKILGLCSVVLIPFYTPQPPKKSPPPSLFILFCAFFQLPVGIVSENCFTESDICNFWQSPSIYFN